MSDRKSKKAQFAQPQKNNLLPVIAVAALIVGSIGLIGWNVLGGRGAGTFPVVSASQGRVLIPATQVSDGKAHFYTYKHGATDINFLVIKSADGQIRAALDSCDVCFSARRGYRQEGDNMVCNKCNQKFPSNLVNEIRGGCNPVPLQRALVEDQVDIPEAELIQGAWYFQGKA